MCCPPLESNPEPRINHNALTTRTSLYLPLCSSVCFKLVKRSNFKTLTHSTTTTKSVLVIIASTTPNKSFERSHILIYKRWDTQFPYHKSTAAHPLRKLGKCKRTASELRPARRGSAALFHARGARSVTLAVFAGALHNWWG